MTQLNIIHQEKTFVVLNKPSGLLTVPGRSPENQDCVTERLKTVFPECIEQPAVHRLDMDTSGLLVLALTREVHRFLSIEFEQRRVRKTYIALLDGIIDQDEGTIELPFRLDPENRPYQIYDPIHGKIGITHWKKLAIKQNTTRIEFRPETGRTHQLRVHAAHPLGLDTPIIGDMLYGTGTRHGHLKLHATNLAFKHPQTGEHMSFRAQPFF